MFDDLKDICNEISERINKKEVKLVENSKSLNFYLLIPVSKIKEINFELKEEIPGKVLHHKDLEKIQKNKTRLFFPKTPGKRCS